jgi:hypothetical protein
LSAGSAAPSVAATETVAVSVVSLIVTVALVGAPMLICGSPLVIDPSVTMTVSSPSTIESSRTKTESSPSVFAGMVTLPLNASNRLPRWPLPTV